MRCVPQLWALIAWGAITPARVAPVTSRPVVIWSVPRNAAPRLKPGERFSITVHGAINPGWHIYALEEPEGGPLETVVALTEASPAELLHVDQGQPDSVMDPAFGQRTTLFRRQATFTLQLHVTSKAPPGSALLRVLIRYQSCNDHVCMPPRTDTIDLPISITR